MPCVRRSFGAAALALCLAGSAAAQGSRELVIQATAGGLHGLASFNPRGVYDTRTSLGLSGAVGVKVVDRLVARGDLAYSKSPIEFHGAEIGADFTKVFGTALFEIRPLPESALMPYILAGGGVGFLNQHTTAKPKQTRGLVAGGLGLGYRVGSTPLSITLESKVYLYQAKGLIGSALSDSRVQADALFGVGLSYGIPLG
jgi:hypothetical protein